jgi:hypothetical protein
VALFFWALAVVLVIGGIGTIIRGQVLLGIVIMIIGFAVGPGGTSLFV